MSLNIEEEDNGVVEEFSHELLIRDKSMAESQQSLAADTTLNLTEGENWLRLVVSLDKNSVLMNTQETASMGAKPFPTITSLSEVGTIDAPTEDCYICIDVDGPYVAIKDMRAPLTSQDSEEDDIFQVCLAKRKKQLADSQASDVNIQEKYHDLELLERRQLKILHPGDLITTASTADGGENGLVLEYRRYQGEHRSGREEEETQENSMVGVVVEAHQVNNAASADTQVSKSSDQPRTQPEDPTPPSQEPSPHSDDEAYKTAIEPTQESYDDSSDEEGGQAEATQAFPAPFTQSPQPKTSSRGNGPVDQSFSVYQTPPSEEEAGKEEATGHGKGESENAAMGTQTQENDETLAEEVDPMNQSTQTIPTPKNASQNDEASTKQLANAIGSQMSPIVEESETPTSERNGEDTALDKQEPSQASTALDDSKKAEGTEDIDSDSSGTTQGDPVEEDEVSDSDALLDEEDVKDASANVKDTPQKPGTAKTSDSIEGNGDERIPDEAGSDRKSTDPADGTMSDSSSITEIDEATPKNHSGKLNSMKETAQKDISGPTTEHSNKDEESHASSITEADMMISPRKGLVMASCVEKEQPEKDADGVLFRKTDKAAKLAVAEEPLDVDNVAASNPNEDDSAADASVKNNSDNNAEDDDETVGDEPSSQPDETQEILNVDNKEAAAGDETAKKPDQEDSALKSSGQADDDDETVVDEVDEVEVTAKAPETTTAKPTDSSSPQVDEDQDVSEDAPIADSTSQEYDAVEQQEKVEEAESAVGQEEKEGDEVTNGVDSLSDQENTESAEPSGTGEKFKTATGKVDESMEDASKEPSSQMENEKVAAAETNETGTETHTPEEASGESDVHHGSHNNSAETEVIDNRSPAVDQKDAPEEKDDAFETPLDVENPAEEAKGVEEVESVDDRSKPTDTAENEVESEKSAEEEAAKEEEKPKAAKPLKKRKLPEATDTMASKMPRRGRSTRNKAPPSAEQEKDSRGEAPAKTPVKKRSARRKAAQPKEEEPEEDESIKTPAKKRGRAGRPVRGSARKRTRGADTPSSSDQTTIRVLMTGVGETEKHKKMVTSIGGEVIDKIEDAHTATHVIAGDDQTSMRRTPKLMIGMCRTSKIVHMDWLIRSAKAREPLACNDFLLLKDKKAEKQYDFVMRESLQRGDELRRNGEFLLSDYWVYVCKGVAGNKAPPEKELELIVDAAGGTWLSSISARTMKDVDASKLIIITPEKPSKKKTKTSEAKDVEKAVKLGAETHPAAWLFDCIIKQSLED